MTAATSLWRPREADALAVHRFPEGVAVFNARDKSTCYLPDPAGTVLDVLLRESTGLAGADILQRLKTTARPEANCVPESLDELQTLLVALEQQLLISACA